MHKQPVSIAISPGKEVMLLENGQFIGHLICGGERKTRSFEQNPILDACPELKSTKGIKGLLEQCI